MEISGLKIASGAFALVCATVAATWYVRADRLSELEDRVKSYESISGANLPKLISDLGEVAGNANASQKLKELTLEFQHTKDKLEDSNRIIEALRNSVVLEEKFTLTPGNAHKILNGNIVLGLSSVSGSYASVKYNNEYLMKSWEIGAYEKVSLGGLNFRIILVSTKEASKTFPGEAIFEVVKAGKDS